jgi:hypothetical protein
VNASVFHLVCISVVCPLNNDIENEYIYMNNVSSEDIENSKIVGWEHESSYQYRKIQPIQAGISLCIVLPKSYATRIGLKKDGFVKVYQQKDKIIIEKA